MRGSNLHVRNADKFTKSDEGAMLWIQVGSRGRRRLELTGEVTGLWPGWLQQAGKVEKKVRC